MPNTLLYHNPGCSKSRAAFDWLESRGVAFDVVDYLQSPLSAEAIVELLLALGVSAREAMRREDALYGELGLYSPKLDEQALVSAIARYPALLQRPILQRGNRAVIARPAERMLELFDDLS